MTTAIPFVGKALCLSFLMIPFKLVEGHLIGPLYRGGSAATGSHVVVLAHARSASANDAAVRRYRAMRAAARKAELRMVSLEAAGLAAELQLADSGLDEKVLEYALLGYHHLLKRGKLRKTQLLSICDFSQSSGRKRLYIIDMCSRTLLFRTYVAHGEGSGACFASDFSNQPESHKSSLGFYVTRNSYYGENGLSLRIDGLDRGFNSLARERNIVIHGAPYVSERILKKFGMLGTTFGCPAIPDELSVEIIPLLREGSCFFIYAPSKKYFVQSSVLNG